MFEEILRYIEFLEGAKTNMKALHWSSRNMSEHKLCDEIGDAIASFQDDFAEEFQGIYGRKITVKMFSAQKSSSSTLTKAIDTILSETLSLYKRLSRRRLSGLRSIIETFIHDFGKYKYLATFVMNESRRSEEPAKINESVKKKISESANDFRKEEIVMNFLSKTYGKGKMPVMKGMVPSYRDVFFFKDLKGNYIKPATAKEVFYHLQDEFKDMYSDEKTLNGFIKKVMKKWFYANN